MRRNFIVSMVVPFEQTLLTVRAGSVRVVWIFGWFEQTGKGISFIDPDAGNRRTELQQISIHLIQLIENTESRQIPGSRMSPQPVIQVRITDSHVFMDFFHFQSRVPETDIANLTAEETTFPVARANIQSMPGRFTETLINGSQEFAVDINAG